MVGGACCNNSAWLGIRQLIEEAVIISRWMQEQGTLVSTPLSSASSPTAAPVLSTFLSSGHVERRNFVHTGVQPPASS
jgi:hypothetical protein